MSQCEMSQSDMARFLLMQKSGHVSFWDSHSETYQSGTNNPRTSTKRRFIPMEIFLLSITNAILAHTSCITSDVIAIISCISGNSGIIGSIIGNYCCNIGIFSRNSTDKRSTVVLLDNCQNTVFLSIPQQLQLLILLPLLQLCIQLKQLSTRIMLINMAPYMQYTYYMKNKPIQKLRGGIK